MPLEYIIFVFGIWTIPEGFVELKHGDWKYNNTMIQSPRTNRAIPDGSHELFEGEDHKYIQGDILTVVRDNKYTVYRYK